MANPFINIFAAMRQNDIFSLDSLTRSLMAPPEQPQPNQVPPQQPQAMMPQQGQQPQQQFPTDPGMGVQPMPAVTGNGPNVWQQPSNEQMGYNQPVSDRPTSITGRLYQGMLDRGIPAHAAAGFMMNGQDESGFNLTAIGDNGNAKGWLQWNGPRKQQFEKMFGGDWSMDNQLDFLRWELDNTEREARDKIFATQTPGEAAAAIVQHFERPAKEHEIRRVNKYLGGGGADWMSSMGYDVGDINYEELEAEDEVDPTELRQYNRRQKQGMVLMALGTGLSQMSRGQPIDISDVVNSYHARQEEMAERMQEIQQERIRRAEREQGLAIEQSRFMSAQANQAALQAQQQAFTAEQNALTRGQQTSERIAGQEYETANDQAERERAAQAATLLWGDKEWAPQVIDAMSVNSEFGMQWGFKQAERDFADAEATKQEEANERVATMYEAAGSPNAATLIRANDPVRAGEVFLQETGDSRTPDIINLEYMKAHPKDAPELARLLRSAGGIEDPHDAAIFDMETAELTSMLGAMEANVAKRAYIDQALTIALDPDFSSGPINAATLGTREFLAQLGLADSDTVTQEQLFQAITNSLIPYVHKQGLGPMTDADAELFRKSLANLENTREANVAILQAASWAMDVEKARYDARHLYFASRGDLGDHQARDAFVDDYLKANNLWGDPFIKLGADMPDAQYNEQFDSMPMGTAYYYRNSDGSYELLIK